MKYLKSNVKPGVKNPGVFYDRANNGITYVNALAAFKLESGKIVPDPDGFRKAIGIEGDVTPRVNLDIPAVREMAEELESRGIPVFELEVERWHKKHEDWGKINKPKEEEK